MVSDWGVGLHTVTSPDSTQVNACFKRSVVSDWGRNPYARGSYSFVGLESSGAPLLNDPLLNDPLLNDPLLNDPLLNVGSFVSVTSTSGMRDKAYATN